MEKIEKIKSFLVNSPDDAFLKHALGLEYIKMGESDKAKELFLEILAKNPDYIGTYYHLAQLLGRLGDFEQAKIWYENGMQAAKKAGDRHAFNELQAALEDLTD